MGDYGINAYAPQMNLETGVCGTDTTLYTVGPMFDAINTSRIIRTLYPRT